MSGYKVVTWNEARNQISELTEGSCFATERADSIGLDGTFKADVLRKIADILDSVHVPKTEQEA